MESWTGFNFGAPPTADHDDFFTLTRLFLSADLHVYDRLRFFVQGKSATVDSRSLQGGIRVVDQDELDLQQFYGELRFPHAGSGALAFRVGRQELAYGRERLISPLDWTNTRRTFEGYSGSFSFPSGAVSAFLTRPVLVNKYEFNERDSATTFYGLYATARPPRTVIGVDAYWLGLRRASARFNGTAGREERQTIGARVWGPTRQGARLDYEAEAAWQFGTVGPGKIRAYMFAGQVGYSLPQVRGAPRVYLNLDYASGDKDSAVADVQTFNQLFPLAHAYLGFMDVAGRQNVVDLSGGLSVRLRRAVSTAVDFHRFQRASGKDGLYGPLAPFLPPPAGAVRSGAAGTSKDIGSELDVTVRYPVGRHLLVVTGYSHCWPGEFIRQSGPSKGVDFGYLTLQFTL
ncbi:MAG: alginate export family protein [Gemmatimonadetes bacterium]|nr:alginate export family protein [Gemmatimonadota bacterium]